MRHRATFLAGAAVGLVLGARIGRERYDQVIIVVQKVAKNPTVRKTAKSVSNKAGELTKAASQQAADKLPKLTETAVNGAKSGAERVKTQLGRTHDGKLEAASRR